MTRTIPGFFIPEQYLLFTFIFHFVHTALARGLLVGARLARESVLPDTPHCLLREQASLLQKRGVFEELFQGFFLSDGTIAEDLLELLLNLRQ